MKAGEKDRGVLGSLSIESMACICFPREKVAAIEEIHPKTAPNRE